jgi:hypothetical protein
VVQSSQDLFEDSDRDYSLRRPERGNVIRFWNDVAAIMKNNMTPDTSDGKIIVICLLLSLGIFTIDSLIPRGVAGGIPYILVILISLWSQRRYLPIYMAIAGSTLTVIGFFSSPADGELWVAFVNRILVLFAIWTVAILGVQRKAIHEEKVEALLKIKVLSGFLPICASARKSETIKVIGIKSNLI